MAKQRFVYKGLLPDLKALDEGWEITDDNLEQLASNIANPLNEQFPDDYVEITEAQYQRIRKLKLITVYLTNFKIKIRTRKQ